MTVEEALSLAVATLADKGLRTPREDAHALLRAATGLSQAQVLAYPERLLSEGEQARLTQWLEKRSRHYPIQYLTGRQEFYGREFEVNPSVLIPRPETELLVEMSLALISSLPDPVVEVLDVGSGSGCIAITLACEAPRVFATGADISEASLEVARRNASALGCSDRTAFVQGDALAPARKTGKKFHLIVSNPPYVENDSNEVDASVRAYEPVEAVFAGPTGLEMYQKIFSGAADLLRRPGWLALEIGYGAGERLAGVAAASGWRLMEQRQDLAGIPRCVVFEPGP